jgi:hypothetical protein
LEELAPAMLALVSREPAGQEVLAVGGPLLGDAPPAIYQRGDTAWQDLSAPEGWTGAIWWGWLSPSGALWLVGAKGQVARGTTSATEVLELGEASTSTRSTFYGVWGSSDSDVWIVGTGGRASPGVILHFDGTRFERIAPTGTASVALSRTLFKVWGSGSDDIMIVGEQGLAIEWDGHRWRETMTNTNARLVTVHGTGKYEKYAVGGLNQGLVLRYDGFAWREIGEEAIGPLSGVHVDPTGLLWVAGDGGYLANWDGVSWSQIDTEFFGQFHAVRSTESGVYGVGGILALSEQSRNGFLGRYGPE